MVAIRKDIDGEARTVGHIPRKISSICSIFIRHGGTICCKVDGHRRYSRDLPQGGLEVPCILTFVTKEEKEWTKTKSLIQSALNIEMLDESDQQEAETNAIVAADRTQGSALPTAMAFINVVEKDSAVINFTESSQEEDQFPPSKRHKKFCEEAIIMGQELSDVDINFAQHLQRCNILS